MKTTSLYQVTNWSYGQKTQKKGGNGGVKGGPGVLGVGGEELGGCRSSRGRSTQKPQVSIQSQS